MKNTVFGFLMLIALSPSLANAIVYYQSKGGALNKISEDAFKNCGTYVFREAGKDDLPEDLKRKCLNALLRGDAINEAKAAAAAAKGSDGTCTYSDKDDLK